jgi:hypothetical protein
MVLTCISLTISEIEHHFMYLFAIYIYSFKKCLFRSFDHYLVGLIFLFVNFHYYNEIADTDHHHKEKRFIYLTVLDT